MRTPLTGLGLRAFKGGAIGDIAEASGLAFVRRS
jgi:hypothetical protein